jgi:predicted nucleic acid-binding protein
MIVVAVLAEPLSVSLPDPDDLPFLEVAAATQAPLISGNLRHFPPERRAGVLLLSPTEFWAGWFQANSA